MQRFQTATAAIAVGIMLLPASVLAQTANSNAGAISGSGSSSVASPVTTNTNNTSSGAVSGSVSGSSAVSSPTVNSSTQSGSQSNSGAQSASVSSPHVDAVTNSGSESNSTSNSAATNAGNTQNYSTVTTNNTILPAAQSIKTVPAVVAPQMTTTLTETCMGSTSAGGAGLGFGFSIGSTWRDGECVRRLNARELAATLGDREAAREVLCANEDIFRVYNALGRPCRLTPKGERNPMWTEASAAPLPPPPPAPPPVSQAAPPPMAREEPVAPPAPPAPPIQSKPAGVMAAKVPEYSLSFRDGSTGLDTGNTRVLEQAVAAYPRWGTVRVVIVNQAEPRILQLRIDTVRAYLTSRGIPGIAQIVVANAGIMPLNAQKDQPARIEGDAPIADSRSSPAEVDGNSPVAAAQEPLAQPAAEKAPTASDEERKPNVVALRDRRYFDRLPD